MAYAILVDEAHRHLGLLESLEAMDEWREGGPKLDTASGMSESTEVQKKRKKTEQEIAQENDRALQELMQMMPGMKIV